MYNKCIGVLELGLCRDPAKASAAEASAAVDAKDGARPKDGKSRRRTRDVRQSRIYGYR